ncbi:hypothetical protein H2Y54_10280 [Pectobacterium aroidearum]|uniref:hypothetical protein n=1 Tax=Pectobacterium aroidearum TaxID=1201031 RepID=UPI0015F00BAA|nr:hypothetical protein [Pectobacterium aroidearum]MBA5236931.1 hypothetical protein [Pectobacterium aroidearum]
MHEKLAQLQEKLEGLHTALNELKFPKENLIENGKNNFPFLNSQDLIYFPKELSNKLSKFKKYVPSEDDVTYIEFLTLALDNSKENIPYLVNTNASVSSPAIFSFLLSMLYISNSINEIFSFEVLANKDLLPKKIINRLELYNSKLNEIQEKSGSIDEKIDTINEAYDAAEGLPTTLKNLRDIKEEIDNIKISSEENLSFTTQAHDNSDKLHKEIERFYSEIKTLKSNVENEAKEYMNSLKNEAGVYIDKCEEAFRTTTSKGLAGAFEDKAIKLNMSIRYWVGGLICSLILGAVVGYFRLQALESYFSSSDTSIFKMIIQIFLSAFSVGAPLWFAWLATKQIGQRFKLAEDYEFKASVSKAYEGYRREAIQLDDGFAQRLFGNALTRLEEPPLRFVEEASHSSPMMEIISSENFKDFINSGGGRIDGVLQKLGLQRKKQDNAKDKNTKIDSDDEITGGGEK